MAGSGRTLLEALDYWTGVQPEKDLFTFLDDTGSEVANLTYKDLTAQTYSLAGKLTTEHGLRRGDRVLLVYPPSLDFIVAFLACVRAGLIAVPVFPPDPRKLKKDLYMFCAIQGSCGARAALTSSVYNYAKKVADIKGFFGAGDGAAWPALRWVVTDSAPAAPATAAAAAAAFPKPEREEVAFLQYTSGSTSEPKGVMITHGNLADNLDLIVTGLSAGDDTVVVSWLPQYHDMGLIGSYLGCLFCGGRGYYMSPVTFIRNPPLWVELISKYRGTHMQAPNFAYGLVARKFLARADRPQLDLRCVRHMINGAEPIDRLTLDRFQATFEKHGLPPGVVFPTYGLAEHTVYVCSNGRQRITVDKLALETRREVVLAERGADWMYAEGAGGEEARPTSVMIGCGKPSASRGVDLRIVDTETGEPVPGEGRVGEIWIRSGSRAAGYWGQPEKTLEDFGGGCTSEFDVDAGYLKTGDLGFLHGEELFICGRQKDLIIIRGRNHYPQDIERTAEGAAGGALRGGCSAAFAVPLGGRKGAAEEVLCYVGELADPAACDPAAVASEVRRAVSAAHGAALSAVRLLAPRTVPKTTSGKIARAWCRRAFVEGALQVVYSLDDDAATGEEEEEAGSAAEGGGDAAAASDGGAGGGGGGGDPAVFNAKAMSDDAILAVCVKEVADLIGCDAGALDTASPLMTLGIDSMGGMQLMVSLENKFRVHLAEDVFFEEGTTLQTLVPIIKCGGQLGPRALLVDLAKFSGIEMVNSDEQMKSVKVRKERLMKCSKKASIMTGKFEDGICFRPGQEGGPTQQELKAIGAIKNVSVMFSIMVLGLVGIVFFFLNPQPAALVSSAILFSCYMAKGYFAQFPAGGRRHPLKVALLKFFNFRAIVEGQHDEQARGPELFVTCSGGDASTGAVLLGLTATSVFGKGLYTLVRSRLLTEAPVLSYYLAAIGVRNYSPELAQKKLSQGNCVAVSAAAPGAPGTVVCVKTLRRHIRLAMATGAALVPCYAFGDSVQQGFSLKQVPVTQLVGEPISVPNTENPSEELVFEYFELFSKGLRKLLRAHAGAYDGRVPQLQMK